MSNLIGRVQNILLTPKTEWPVIAAEPDTIGGLYTRYILIVSALGPIAMFLKNTIIGVSIPFAGTYRVGMGAGLGMMVSTYVLGLIAVFLFSLIINVLAPSFGGQKDPVQALKAAAYAATAGWVAGIAQIIPWIDWLIGLAGGIYSIYLLYVGLPHTMKSPVEKAAGYTAVSVIAAIVLGWICWAIIGQIFWRSMVGPMGVPNATISSSGSFEPNSTGAALEAWAKNLEAAGKAVDESAKQNSGVPSGAAIGALVGAAVAGGKGVDALPTETMKGFLPETLGGLPRTSASASRNAALGFQVAEATAGYSDGSGKSLELQIHDAGGAKGILALASWANVEEEKEWQGGYEKTYRDGGRIVHERWDSGSKSGEYSVIVGDRFSVEVSGSAESIDALKAALGTVNVSGLEAAAAAQPAPTPTG
jgi:Yip1-like protein